MLLWEREQLVGIGLGVAVGEKWRSEYRVRM